MQRRGEENWLSGAPSPRVHRAEDPGQGPPSPPRSPDGRDCLAPCTAELDQVHGKQHRDLRSPDPHCPASPVQSPTPPCTTPHEEACTDPSSRHGCHQQPCDTHSRSACSVYDIGGCSSPGPCPPLGSWKGRDSPGTIMPPDGFSNSWGSAGQAAPLALMGG